MKTNGFYNVFGSYFLDRPFWVRPPPRIHLAKHWFSFLRIRITWYNQISYVILLCSYYVQYISIRLLTKILNNTCVIQNPLMNTSTMHTTKLMVFKCFANWHVHDLKKSLQPNGFPMFRKWTRAPSQTIWKQWLSIVLRMGTSTISKIL